MEEGATQFTPVLGGVAMHFTVSHWIRVVEELRKVYRVSLKQ